MPYGGVGGMVRLEDAEMLNVPPSWPRMSDHARACYLVDSHQARNYREARIKVGRMAAQERRRVTTEQYQAGLEKRGLS